MGPQDRGDDDAVERERVTRALVAAADGVDPQQVPVVLCQTGVDLLPVTGASVSLSAGQAVRVVWCATDTTALRLAEVQYTLGDGPCQAAVDHTAPVLAADLTSGPDARRWPVFAQEAVTLGVHSVCSLPLGTNGLAFGTLDFYRDTVGALEGRDLKVALLLCDALTFALAGLLHGQNPRPGGSEGGVASWVEAAEADHSEVNQAVGMIMVQLEANAEEALDRLRARAFAQGRTVTEMAREVLARTVRLSAELGPTDRKDRQRGKEEEGR